VEHLFHRMSPHCPDDVARAIRAPEKLDPKTLADRVFEASREVARPTLFSLLIIIAAYLPIFSLQRVEGRIFAPLANTVVSALLGALLVSFTLVPVLALFALRKDRPERASPLLGFAARVYEPSL